MRSPSAKETWRNSEQFIRHIRERLSNRSASQGARYDHTPAERDSVVLLPLTNTPGVASEGVVPSLILNKRSERVRQAGDLCYPGGSIAALDGFLSLLLRLPFLPLAKWPYSNGEAVSRKTRADTAVLLATGLREAWEEMRMNPLRLAFLGLLPVERLVLFNRRIHPLSVWVSPQRRYSPNWEVARIVHIPISELLNASNYARYRPTFSGALLDRREEFPCFIHQGKQGREILWGVSYRITMHFIWQVFDFAPPAAVGLPLIEGRLSTTYMG